MNKMKGLFFKYSLQKIIDVYNKSDVGQSCTFE